MKKMFLLLSLFGFLLSSPMWAQTPANKIFTLKEMISLQEKTRKLSQDSIPKTVLIRSFFTSGRDSQGAGSGAIISEDGYILTCSHVIGDETDRVEVVLSDKTILPAKKLGWNRKNDYCLLKVEAPKPLPHFELGNSDTLSSGDWVIAIGHPGGPSLDRIPSCSLGRVTQLHARLPAQSYQRYYGNAIKSDAPIFSGNSGGPLINLEGQLIGINAAILLHNEDSFSIPINEIREVLPLLKEGEVLTGYGPGEYPSALKKRLPSARNGFLGVKTETIDEFTKDILEISGGAWVKEVLDGSAAHESGLQIGDIILQVDQHPIRDPYQLTSVVQAYKPFAPAMFTVMRKGKIMQLKVIIGKQ